MRPQDNEPVRYSNVGRWTESKHSPIARFGMSLSSRLALILLASFLHLTAIQPAYGQNVEGLSEESQVSLLTIAPGDQVYSLFGHSAIRVFDPIRGIDVTFNYGTFSFGNPLTFVPRFAYGKLDYMLAVDRTADAITHYLYEERPVVEQILNLDREQRTALFQFLANNARPENRTYRYDFLFDNCSTRIRDAFESTLGDAVTFTPLPDPQKSFRDLLDPYLLERPDLDLGIDLLLGSPVDRIAAPDEAVFLPDVLKEHFDHARIVSDGKEVPLVARTDTILHIDGYAAPEPAFPWPGLILTALFLVGLALTIVDFRKKSYRFRWLDVLVFSLAGVAGLLIAFLWFISEHHVTANNWNVLWALPTHLVAAILLVKESWSSKRWLRYYLGVSALLATLIVAGWPFWPQDFHRAAIPLILLVLLRSAWLFFRDAVVKS